MQQLRPYYHRIRANQDDALKTVTFPRFDAFLKLDSVRSMWYPLDAVVDKPNWTQKLASVDEDAQSYRKTRRTEAIRVILAATNGVELDTLPTHSRAYEDENKFGEAFFKRITSLFMHENIDLDDDDAPITYDIVPFPDCLALSTSTDPDVDYKLAKVKTARQVVVIRILLGLAGLEEDSATREQLDEVGRRFRWIDHPVKIYRKAKGTWLEVVRSPLFLTDLLCILTTLDLPCSSSRCSRASPRTRTLLPTSSSATTRAPATAATKTLPIPTRPPTRILMVR